MADTVKMWHYKVNGQSYGPVTATELQRLAKLGALTGCLVRTDDSEKWVSVEKVKGLVPPKSTEAMVEARAPIPAAKPKIADNNQRVLAEQTAHTQATDIGRQKSKNKKSNRSMFLAMFAFSVVIVTISFFILPPTSSGVPRTIQNTNPPVPSSPRLTKSSFESMVRGKDGDGVRSAVGSPNKTQTLSLDEYWYYDDIAIDPLTGKPATAQLFFPGGSIGGGCSAINWL